MPQAAADEGPVAALRPVAHGRAASTTRWLCLGYALFIVYGSLLPFDFSPLEPALAWANFQRIPYLQLGVESRADWIANGVLYAPLGALMTRLLAGSGGGWRYGIAALAVAAACTALAFAVEFAQMFFPPRTVSQNDLIAECIGSALGIVAAPLASPWARRLRDSWPGEGRRVVPYLLQAYSVAYLLFCFFPYDLLLSAQEVLDKAHSTAWGWLIATPADDSAVRTALRALAEVALTVPIGWLLAWRARPRPGEWRRAALTGAALGLIVEAGQFMIETGISQGLSVATRALGVAGGMWTGRRAARDGIEPLRRWLVRHTAGLAAAYVVLLGFAIGGWGGRWHGVDAAAVTWHDLRLTPFYYHYFTTEANALTSAASVVAMVLPLAALCWARRISPWHAATLAFALTGAFEVGKLFVDGLRPDPTNPLIAAAACGLLVRLSSPRVLQLPTPPSPSPSPPRSTVASPPAPMAWPLLVLPLVAWAALTLPALPLLATAVIAACAAAVAWRPVWLIAIVPAALPVFDFAPWTGRVLFDEFDLLLAACLAVGFARTPPAPVQPLQPLRLPTLTFALVGSSLAISAARAAWPLPAFDAGAWWGFDTGFSALRIGKGALWAWLFVACVRRLPLPVGRGAELFGAGILVGLALALAVTLRERSAFAGWLDFASDYRVTGPFSAMHRGGAYIECFLAVASAYAVASLLEPHGRLRAAATATLLAATAYVMMLTYSRNGYAAFAWVVAAGLAAGWLRGRAGGRRRVAVLLAATAVAGAIAATVLAGPFARERLAQVRQDFAVRTAHWSDALAIRDPGMPTRLFGMGLGSFPSTHFWRSREPLHAASFRWLRDGESTFLRLGSGAPVYVEQIVDLPAGRATTLRARLRGAGDAAAALNVTLCRKWLLTSTDCRSTVLRASAAGGWQAAQAALPAFDAVAPFGPPLKLSLVTPVTGSPVDVDDLQLVDPGGTGYLANGDFAAGMDRWFFSTDTDPPWHIHNLAVAVLFDQGGFGVAAWAALLIGALAAGARAVWRGSSAALPAFIALVAFLVSGTLNTLIDTPRFLWLLLVLAWWCAAGAPRSRSAGP